MGKAKKILITTKRHLLVLEAVFLAGVVAITFVYLTMHISPTLFMPINNFVLLMSVVGVEGGCWPRFQRHNSNMHHNWMMSQMPTSWVIVTHKKRHGNLNWMCELYYHFAWKFIICHYLIPEGYQQYLNSLEPLLAQIYSRNEMAIFAYNARRY